MVVVCGVAGSGKTTVANALAERLQVMHADADHFHPETNRRKMASGVPLTDADRGPWLTAISDWIDTRLAAGERGVINCSCLKRRYRDRLRQGRSAVRMVLLMVDEETIRARLGRRMSHFFPETLAASQFAELELPSADEPILTVDGTRPVDHVVTAIMTGLGI